MRKVLQIVFLIRKARKDILLRRCCMVSNPPLNPILIKFLTLKSIQTDLEVHGCMHLSSVAEIFEFSI